MAAAAASLAAAEPGMFRRTQFAVRCAAHLSRVVAGMPLDFVQEAIRLPLHAVCAGPKQGRAVASAGVTSSMLTRT